MDNARQKASVIINRRRLTLFSWLSWRLSRSVYIPECGGQYFHIAGVTISHCQVGHLFVFDIFRLLIIHSPARCHVTWVLLFWDQKKRFNRNLKPDHNPNHHPEANLNHNLTLTLTVVCKHHSNTIRITIQHKAALTTCYDVCTPV